MLEWIKNSFSELSKERLYQFSNTVENISLIELDAQYHLQSFYARYGFFWLVSPMMMAVYCM